MIDLAILGLLDEQDLHGYELKKQLAELVGSRSGVSFGSLYPALARLEKAGAVEGRRGPHRRRPTIPMTGALSGELAAFRARLGRPARSRRTRKVYGITEVGRQRLRELLTDESTDDRTFTVQVAFCRALSPAERLGPVRAAPGRAQPAPGRAHPRRRRRPHRHLPHARCASTTPAPSSHDLAWIDELHRRHPRRAAPTVDGTDVSDPPHRRIPPMSTIRLAIAGVGNCASSPRAGPRVLPRRRSGRRGARPHARRARRLPRPRHRGRGRVRRRRRPRSASTSARPSGPARTTRSGSPTWASSACTVQRGPTLDGFGKYYRADLRGVARPRPSTSPRRCATPRPTCSCPTCPVGSEEAQKHYAQACIDAGVAFVNAIPVFIASRPRVGGQVRRRRRADRRRRHQEPGRRHHRAPHPGPPLRGPRPGARPHLPAQRRRQHGLQEHARARAPRVEEDLQDPGRHQPDRPRHRRRRRAHRPVRPRGLARRPQVGLHPPRGPQLRRRARSTSS